jgi:hypothetical protein
MLGAVIEDVWTDSMPGTGKAQPRAVVGRPEIFERIKTSRLLTPAICFMMKRGLLQLRAAV